MLARMDGASMLRSARLRAGLSQAALAARSGTSQATISAYERGRKTPSVQTLSRLLAATGNRLTVESAPAGPIEPSRARHARTARTLLDVLALAEALPKRHDSHLLYPRLPVRPS
jgi:transcriptional regulator with XRE-family HTH domain